jgi:UDP-N-acetylmuramate dehydrogenase
MKWLNILRGSVLFKEPLCRHTSLCIGGPVSVLAEPRDAQELKVLILGAKRATIPLRILGAGSNLLVADKGVRAVVCRLRAPSFSRVSFRSREVTAGAGCMLSALVREAAQRGDAGLEFLAGIPGTVGGAVMMNAGAWGRCIGDVARRVTVMDMRGQIRVLEAGDIRWKYRDSGLGNVVVLEAVFALRRSTPARVRAKMLEYAKKRKVSQDLRFPSAGSVFRNPEDDAAGRLIDACGLKGTRQGGASISPVHANFIVNTGRATAHDVMLLMQKARRAVRAKFGVTLEAEIKLWK